MARKENKTLRNEKKPTTSVVNTKKGGKVVKKQLESKTRTKPSSNAKCPKCSKSVFNFNKGKNGVCSSCLKNEVNSSSKSQGKSLLKTPKISTDESSRRSNRVKNPEVKSNPAKSNAKTRSPATSRQLDSPKTKANSTRNTRSSPKENVAKKSLSGAKRQTSTNITKTGVKQQQETTTRKSGNKMNLRGKKRCYTQLASGIETDSTIPLKKNRSSNKEVESRGSRSKKPTVKGSEWINKIQSKKSTVIKDEISKKENIKSPLKIKSPKLKVIKKKENKNISSKTPQSSKNTVKRDHIIKQKGNARELPKRQINKSINIAKRKTAQTPSASKKRVKQIVPPKIASTTNVLQRKRSNITAKHPVKEQGNANLSQVTNKKPQISKNNLAKSIQKKFSSFTNKNKLAQTDLKENVVVAQGILQDIINSVGKFVDDRLPSKSKNIVETEISNALELNIIKTLHVETSGVNVDDITTNSKKGSLSNSLSPNDENEEDIKFAQTSAINVDPISTDLTRSNESETHLNAANLDTDSKPPNSSTNADDEINIVNNSLKTSVEMSEDKSSSSLSENQHPSSNNNLVFSNEISTEIDHEKHDTKINNKDRFIPYNHVSEFVENIVNNSLNVKEDNTEVSECTSNIKKDEDDIPGDKIDMQNRNDVSAANRSTSKDRDMEQKKIDISENMSIEINSSPIKISPEIKHDCNESKAIHSFKQSSVDNEVNEKTKCILLENNHKGMDIPDEENNACLKKEENPSSQSLETKTSNVCPDKPIARNDSPGEEILQHHIMIETSSTIKDNNVIHVECTRNEDSCEVNSSVKESPMTIKNESLITSTNERNIVEMSDKVVAEKGNIAEKENKLDLIDTLPSQNVDSESEHREETSSNTCISNKENNTSLEEKNTKQIESDCEMETNDAVILEEGPSNSQSISIQKANSIEEKTINSITNILECKNNIVSTEDVQIVYQQEENLLITTNSDKLSNVKADDCTKELNVSISVGQDSCKPSSNKCEDDSFVQKGDLKSDNSTIGCENDKKLILETTECNVVILSHGETLLTETSTKENTSKEISSTSEEKVIQATTIEHSTIKRNDDSILSKESDSYTSEPTNSCSNESISVADKSNVDGINEFKNDDNTNLGEYNTTLHSKHESTIMISNTETIIANEDKSKLVELASPSTTESDCVKEQINSLADKNDSCSFAQPSCFLVEEDKSVKQKTDNNALSQNVIAMNNSDTEHLVVEPENRTSEEMVLSENYIPSSTMIENNLKNENRDNLILGKCSEVIVETIEGNNLSNSTSKLECLDHESSTSTEHIVQDNTMVEENIIDNKMVKGNLYNERLVNISNILDVNTDKESSENEGQTTLDTNTDSNCTNKNIVSHIVGESLSHTITINDSKTDKEIITSVEENIPNATTTYETNSTNDLESKGSDSTMQTDDNDETTLNDNNSALEEKSVKCPPVKDDINVHTENPLKELDVPETTPIQESKNKCILNDNRKVLEENTLSNNIIDCTEKDEKTDCISVGNCTNEPIQHHSSELQALPNAKIREIDFDDKKEGNCPHLEEDSKNGDLSIDKENLTDLSADIRCNGQKMLPLQSNKHSNDCEEENEISCDKTNAETTFKENSNCNSTVNDSQLDNMTNNVTSVEYNINDQVQNSPVKLLISSNAGYQENNSSDKNEGSCTVVEEEDISLTLSLDDEESTNVSRDGMCTEIQDSCLVSNTSRIMCEEENPVNNTTDDDRKQVGSCDDLSVTENMEVDNVEKEVLLNTNKSLSILDDKLIGYSVNTSVNVLGSSQLDKPNIGGCNISSNQIGNESQSNVIISEDISTCLKQNKNLQDSKIVSNDKLPVTDVNQYQIASSTKTVETSSLHIIEESKTDYENHMQLEKRESKNNDFPTCDSKIQNNLDKTALEINDSELVSSGEVVKEIAGEKPNTLDSCNESSEIYQNREFISHNDNCSSSEFTKPSEKVESKNTDIDDTNINNPNISSSSDIICIGNKSPAVQEDVKIVDEGECISPEVEEKLENNEKLEGINVSSNFEGDDAPEVINVDASLNENGAALNDNDAPLNDKVNDGASVNDKDASLSDNVTPLTKIDVFLAANSEISSTSDQAVDNDIEREHQSVSIVSHSSKNEINLKHSESVIGEIRPDHGTEQPQSIIAEQNSGITNVENLCLNKQRDNIIANETEKCKLDDVGETLKSNSPKCASEELISPENNPTSITDGSSEMEVIEVDTSQQDPEMYEVQMEEVEETTHMEVDCVDSIDNTHSLPPPDSKANGQMSMEVS